MREVRRALRDIGYEEEMIVNSSHRVFRHVETGKTILVGPDYFKGKRAGWRWLRTIKRRAGKTGK